MPWMPFNERKRSPRDRPGRPSLPEDSVQPRVQPRRMASRSTPANSKADFPAAPVWSAHAGHVGILEGWRNSRFAPTESRLFKFRARRGVRQPRPSAVSPRLAPAKLRAAVGLPPRELHPRRFASVKSAWMAMAPVSLGAPLEIGSPRSSARRKPRKCRWSCCRTLSSKRKSKPERARPLLALAPNSAS